RAAAEAEGWYRGLIQKGNRLLLFSERTAENAPLPWPQWHEGVEALMRESAQPPFRRADRLRESRSLPAAPAVTYATVLAFPTVDQARSQVEEVRQRLERPRDLPPA